MRLSISRRFCEGLAAADTIEGIDGVQAGLEGHVHVSGALVIEPQFNRAGNFS